MGIDYGVIRNRDDLKKSAKDHTLINYLGGIYAVFGYFQDSVEEKQCGKFQQ